MSIQGRESIHKSIPTRNTKTKTTSAHSSQDNLTNYATLDTDDSLLSDSISFEDHEVTNNSRKLQSFKSDIRSRSTSTVRNDSPNGLDSRQIKKTDKRTESPRNHLQNVTRTESPIRGAPLRNVSKVSKSNASCYIGGVVGVMLCILAWFACSISPNVSNVPDDLKRCTYSDLQSKYKQESSYLWAHLKSGIEDILNDRSDKPGVYLFVHSGGTKANELISDIARASSSCFDPLMKPVEIANVDFTSRDALDDYGYVIEKYKQIIKKGNVILIANLNEIPAKAARALHSICDTVSPIVPNVMIFLSLVAEHKGERVIDTAEESLRQLWDDKLIPSELDPLITRVTDEVILLQSK